MELVFKVNENIENKGLVIHMDYLTLICFPARIDEPDILLSFLSLATVVWFLFAISERVSPFLMVTFLPPRARLAFALRLARAL